MLVLSRRRGHQLLVGHDVEIEVLEVRGKQVRLGIRAPSDVRVFRSELKEAGGSAGLQESESESHGENVRRRVFPLPARTRKLKRPR